MAETTTRLLEAVAGLKNREDKETHCVAAAGVATIVEPEVGSPRLLPKLFPRTETDFEPERGIFPVVVARSMKGTS